MDDEISFNALRQAVAAGKGVVLQGDDMAWSWGNAFSLEELTHTAFESNGTDLCGVPVDNNAHAASYDVKFDRPSTIPGVAGMSFSYGDDIDVTNPKAEGEHVLAWATLGTRGRPVCERRTPVVIAFDPNEQ